LIGLVFLSVSLFVSKFQSQKNKNSFSHFRLLFLSNVLIWTVIFNHKAESPTFVIAVAGMAILFSFQTQNKNWIYFMIVAFVLTSLSSTDLFPRFVREEFIKPWRLKAFPAIALWFFIQIAFLRSLFFKKEINLSSPVLLNQRNGYTQ
jgi:hypothetical protein